jgi:hypothetical protein
MNEENPDSIKAHDIPKDDPDYQIKVSEILKKRFDEERKKSIEREKLKMEAGKKKETKVVDPPPSPVSSEVPKLPARDPEEFVKRGEIQALVNQLNKSFSIIEKNRVKSEKFFTELKKLITELE